MRAVDEFCGSENGYARSVTLGFRLLPCGKTGENIKKYGMLENDRKRADAYGKVKELIDGVHRDFIFKSLDGRKINWMPYADKIAAYRKEKTGETAAALKDEQSRLRLEICRFFRENPDFGRLFGKELFTELLPRDSADVKIFDGFCSYFSGFHKNRMNMYSADEKHTAVPYRIVNENFPKHYDNMMLYNRVKKVFPAVIEETGKSLAAFLHGLPLDDVFSCGYFSGTMTQQGIDFYNTVIGGYTEDGTVKIKGFNECLNLARQRVPEERRNDLRGKMSPLYRQILGTAESVSFIPEKFSDDRSVYDAVEKYYKETVIPALKRTEKLFNTVKNCPEEYGGIWIPQKELASFSADVTGRWNTLPDAVYAAAVKKYGNPDEKKSAAAKIGREVKRPFFSLSELQDICDSYAADTAGEEKAVNVTGIAEKYFSLDLGNGMNLDNIGEKTGELYEKIRPDAGHALREEKEYNIPLKAFLDAVLGILHFMKHAAAGGEAEKSSVFYPDFDGIIDSLSGVVPLYNRVRNYVTQKAGGAEKYRLNFDCPTLAAGWDRNKEQVNDTLLFMKDGKYYLGILNPENKIKFPSSFDSVSGPCYSKMTYRLLPGPNKMLPHVFFPEGGIRKYSVPEDILEGYRAGKHLKGDSFDIGFCHRLIAWFKNAIDENADWREFGFHFSDTESYADISGFYQEVEDQGYRMTFTPVPCDFIDRAADEGKLFLFQIYCRDFSGSSYGRKNLHTLYWENLFSEENRRSGCFRLNGGAGLFYRPASVKKIRKHEKGSVLVGRTDTEGKTIPDDIYRELFLYRNGRLSAPLSAAASAYLGRIAEKKAEKEIIKDRRFTEDVFLFHCSVTVNSRYHGVPAKVFNSRVRECLGRDPSAKIIGIRRGEKNLLYLVLVNQKGVIERQTSLNIVRPSRKGSSSAVDYREKISVRAGEMDDARKNWQTIGNIRELEEGYLSAVVHEISLMIVEENAALVLEDPFYGEERGHFTIGSQVYGKFVSMLLNKLGFLSFKDRPASAAGGVQNAYQLVISDGSSAGKLAGKQCGFVFFVSSMYTSGVDPATGFAGLFRLGELTNADRRKDFFGRFDSIRYDEKTDSFVFSFDYGSFGAVQDFRKKWDVYTRGFRAEYDSGKRKTEKVFPSEILKAAFDAAGWAWKDGRDLVPAVRNAEKTKNSILLFNELFRAFSLSLRMKNRDPDTKEDCFISPVCGKDGSFFDTRSVRNPDMPAEPDAVGAYHTALKGLYLMKNGFAADGRGLVQGIGTAEWLEFLQKKEYAE